MTTTSDSRFKYDVQHNVPGLAFINKLKPVTYRLDGQKLEDFTKTGIMNASFHESKDAVVKTDFMAQDVEATAKELGFDFDGVHVPTNDKDYYALSYSQFVVPLVKAVQEMSAEIQDMRTQIATLKAENSNRKLTTTISETSNTAFDELAKKVEKVEEMLNQAKATNVVVK